MLYNIHIHNNCKMDDKIKRVGPETDTFEAGEKKYIVYKSISLARYREYERLKFIAGFGADYQTLFGVMKSAYEDLQTLKAADASVKLHNAMSGLARKIDKHQDPVLLMCTLFINTENEDLSKWSEPLANEKITDWEGAGYDVQGFFHLYMRWMPTFEAGFLLDSPTISEEAESSAQPVEYSEENSSRTFSETPIFTGSN